MRKLVVLLVAVLVLGWCGVAGGNPLYPNVPGLQAAIQEIKALGLESSDKLNQIYVNFSGISNGTVVSTVYSGAEQRKDVNTHSVIAQTYQDAWGKVSHFALDLNNQYAQTAALGIGPISNDLTVSIYIYGQDKDQLTYAIVSGLTECIGKERITISSGGNHSGSSSWVNNYTPAAMASKTITSFKVGEKTITTASGTAITMDVAPYIKDNRTYTPVRYLAYALGVPEDGVKWDEATQTVTIIKDNTTIKLTIGSRILNKNTETIIMDVAPELVPPGRTMLPARWVSEALGATVIWDEKTQQVTIEITQQGQ